MSNANLNYLLKCISEGKEPLIKYYIIGMWIITNDYTDNGFLIDFIVCKGVNVEEAIEEAKKYENTIRKIKPKEQVYLPLTVAKSIQKATINANEIYDLLIRKKVLFDENRIQELYNETLQLDQQIKE